MERGEGERLHEERRKRFWTILAWLMVVGMLSGAVAGFVMAEADHGRSALSRGGAAAATASIIAVAIAVIFGSWRFFKQVDEVEVADNLWASLIGFYAYGILFPAWWLMSRLKLLREPDQWLLYGGVMIIATIAYAYRKWINR